MKDKLDFDELESRFEMQSIILEDGSMIDSSSLTEEELAAAGSSECTSTCRPG